MTVTFEEIGINVEYTCFAPEGKVCEWHAIFHVMTRHDSYADQLSRLMEAEKLFLNDGRIAIFRRYYLSDIMNQMAMLRDALGEQYSRYSISAIQQPPLDGSKIALWMYGTTTADSDSKQKDIPAYTHHWHFDMMSDAEGSASQTTDILTRYEAVLREKGMTMAENCIRTWFYVRDVDTQYKGMVIARRENFMDEGLTPSTHYLASTGIGGTPAKQNAILQYSAYAISGIQPQQQKYLYALDHLNKTIDYGVTFERGTLVEYGDRGHIFISGTASIDNKGDVVHVGDIVNQTLRMWENVEALLREGDMGWKNVMQIIVYLRDIADTEVVSRMFRERFPDTPYLLTQAPVCRPAWLIEMECIAIDERTRQYPDFVN